MAELSELKSSLRVFICADLIRNPAYALIDDEPLVTGGLIDSFAIARIGVFVEKTFGIYIPDTDLTVENMDSLNRIAACILAAGGKTGRAGGIVK